MTTRFIMAGEMYPEKLERAIERTARKDARFESEVGYQVAEHIGASAKLRPSGQDMQVDITFPYDQGIHEPQEIETAILNLLTRLEDAIDSAVLQKELLDTLVE